MGTLTHAELQKRVNCCTYIVSVRVDIRVENLDYGLGSSLARFLLNFNSLTTPSHRNKG
jgi:hypothetical protein